MSTPGRKMIRQAIAQLVKVETGFWRLEGFIEVLKEERASFCD
jgi:hypothetical protein